MIGDVNDFFVWVQCFRKGAQMIQCSIRGLLTEQVQALKLAYGVQFIVNCSGLGSIDLAGDKELFPARGITSNPSNEVVNNLKNKSGLRIFGKK